MIAMLRLTFSHLTCWKGGEFFQHEATVVATGVIIWRQPGYIAPFLLGEIPLPKTILYNRKIGRNPEGKGRLPFTPFFNRFVSEKECTTKPNICTNPQFFVASHYHDPNKNMDKLNLAPQLWNVKKKNIDLWCFFVGSSPWLRFGSFICAAPSHCPVKLEAFF